MTKIVIIEDEEALRSNLLDLLDAEGFVGFGAPDGARGLQLIFAERPDLVICDIRMQPVDGHEVLRALRARPDTAFLPFIFLTAKADRADIRTGMNLGADDYLTKPFTRAELLASIQSRLLRRHAIGEARSESPAAGPEPPLHGPPAGKAFLDLPPGAVVRSPRTVAVYEQARLAALQGNISILILGETGVGKDVLARAIHRWSPRSKGPFLALNCAALPETLLESELFGHEKGAFSGADHARAGMFESAAGGTVFLDEIGDLPAAAQVKLLRVLEEKQVTRVGARAPLSVDVRFVAATHRDLESEIARGTFRQDLFFRIHGLSVTLPPLRDRPEEIEPLARMFLAEEHRRTGRPRAPALSAEALSLLESHSWPGNARELRHVLERAAVLCSGDTLLPAHLPDKLGQRQSYPATPPQAQGAGKGPDPERDSAEKHRTLAALERCGGNQTQAAELLGISRRTLVYRLSAYGLTRPRRRPGAPDAPGEGEGDG